MKKAQKCANAQDCIKLRDPASVWADFSCPNRARLRFLWRCCFPKMDEQNSRGLRRTGMNTGIDKHYTVLAALFIGLGILGVIGILVLIFIFGIGSVIMGSAAAHDPSVPGAVVLIPVTFGLVIASFIAISIIPGFVAAYGLLGRRSWGPIMGLIAGIICLPNVPLGTGVGIYAIWLFLQTQPRT